jgi:hypothetical protein
VTGRRRPASAAPSRCRKYERGGASRLYDLSRVLDVPVSFYFDDVTPDAAAAARSEASEGGGESTPQRHEPDPMMRRETPELVRAYYRIAGPQIRHRLFRPHQGHRRRLRPKCLKPDQGG